MGRILTFPCWTITMEKERMVNDMIYILDGVEIQYRECQILRDTARDVLQEKNEPGGLSQHKEEWIERLEHLAEENALKSKYAVPLAAALEKLPGDMFEAVSEYVEFLVEKGKGIDIMIPFTATNLRTILPVNTHERMDTVYTEN